MMTGRRRGYRVAKPSRPPPIRTSSPASARAHFQDSNDSYRARRQSERAFTPASSDIDVNSTPIRNLRGWESSIHNSFSSSVQSVSRQSHEIIIDEDGDLRLVMTSDDDRPTVFIVCPRTLARASGVWRQRLCGQRRQLPGLQSSSSWVITISDDISPEALTTLLHIAHGNFDDVPQTVDAEALGQIIMAADIFEMVSFVCPFLERWLRTVKGNPFLPQQIWIPWTLGHRPLFLETATALALCLRVDRSGRIYVPGHETQEFEQVLEEMGVTDQLKDLHQRILEDVLHILRGTVHSLELDAPICGPAHEMCQSVMLGSLIRTLAHHGWWPLTNVQLYQSVEATLSSLGSISLPLPSNDRRDHSSCRHLLDAMIQQLDGLKTATIQLTKAQMTHLRSKAKETGFQGLRMKTQPVKRKGKKKNRVVEVFEIDDED